MLLEQTYFFAALVIALICTWIVFFALSLKLLFAQQKSSALSLLLAIILGPLIPFWHFFKHRSKLASKSILLNLIAIVIVVCTVIIPSYVTSRSLKIIGEELQSYIAMYIIIGSFLAGYSLSARSKKIAFIEGLFLTAFFACLYVPFVP